MTILLNDWPAKIGALAVAVVIWWVIRTAIDNNNIERGVIDSVPSNLPLTGST